MEEHSHDTRQAITRFLFIRDAPAPVDLAIVLGSPTVSSLTPAIDLYLAGMVPRILISGHGPTPGGMPEWALYRDHALAAGVAPDDLLIEPDATNTRENLLLSADVVDRRIGWPRVGSVALCAKAFHMRRVYMTARKIFPEHVRLLLLPGDGTGDLRADDWWTTPRGRNRVLEEIGRIATYSLKNHLGDV